MKIDGLSKFGIADWIGAILFVAIPASILILAGSSSLPDPMEKLLAVSPLLPGTADGFEDLSSATRYRDYVFRGGVFVLLLGLGILAAHLARRWRNR